MSRLAWAAAGGVAYPEREAHDDPLAWWRAQAARLPAGACRAPAAFLATARRVERDGTDAAPETLAARARTFGAALRGDAADAPLAEVFGLVAAAARRTLGYTHHDVQLAAGRALYEGRLVEMATGEGKTLAATLPAAAAALTGIPVHVVTTNDYLAQRDAETLAPLYALLGLRAAFVVGELTPAERQAAYAADVTYCSSKELGFDYLKDRIALGALRTRLGAKVAGLVAGRPLAERLLLRGLHFAIVDEADSVLIDEARTPLIISAGKRAAEAGGALFAEAVALADGLATGRDFVRGEDGRTVRLTDAGRRALAVQCEGRHGLWRGPRRREALVEQALTALHAYRRDHDYLVRDDAVMIIDENTGRVHPDRAWEHGLQQLIEAKEGVTVTAPREVLARISYQRFFCRYARLAGMTGTAREVAPECRRVYALSAARVPTHRPVQRRFLGHRVFATRELQTAALVARVRGLTAQRRPVLVGTRSVAASEALSAALEEAGITHRVLNARQDAEEAETIAHAGESGAVTIATSMAGRGTDIALGKGVAARGGLHVVCFERHDAGRIDRQLWGRSARQGDPGSYEVLMSLDDELARRLPGAVRAALRGAVATRAGERLAARALLAQQRAVEREHARARRTLERIDEHMDDVLAFAGDRR